MSDLSKAPVAILVSDLHLNLNRPSGRSEADWLAVLKDRLRHLADTATHFFVPIICAGDVFDHWSPPAELINLVLDHSPRMWAIPGQHDLPGHKLADVGRGAYGTLVRAGCICPIDTQGMVIPGHPSWHMFGAPWGVPMMPSPLAGYAPDVKSLLVAHTYMANGKDTAYTTAPADTYLVAKAPKGYTACLYGDNHIPWQATVDGCTHFNHGAWLPRSTAEGRYQGLGLGLLHNDGSVTRLPYTHQDSWLVDLHQAPSTVPSPADYDPGRAIAAQYAFYTQAIKQAGVALTPFTDRISQAISAMPPGDLTAQALTTILNTITQQKARI